MRTRRRKGPPASQHTIIGLPAAKESDLSGAPEVLCVPQAVGRYARRRDRTHPASCALPRANHRRIVYADRLIVFNDSTPAIAHLPFQAAAGQIFVDAALPDVAPKIFVTFGSFAGLNSGGHLLKFVPGFGRLAVAVLSKKTGAVIQKTNVGVMRHGHPFVADRVAGQRGGILRGQLRSKVGLQIHQILIQYSGPDHINAKHVGSGGAFLEQLAPQGQLIERAIGARQAFDLNSRLRGELLQIMGQRGVQSGGIPLDIQKRKGDWLWGRTCATAEGAREQKNTNSADELEKTRLPRAKSWNPAVRGASDFQRRLHFVAFTWLSVL